MVRTAKLIQTGVKPGVRIKTTHPLEDAKLETLDASVLQSINLFAVLMGELILIAVKQVARMSAFSIKESATNKVTIVDVWT